MPSSTNGYHNPPIHPTSAVNFTEGQPNGVDSHNATGSLQHVDEMGADSSEPDASSQPSLCPAASTSGGPSGETDGDTPRTGFAQPSPLGRVSTHFKEPTEGRDSVLIKWVSRYVLYSPEQGILPCMMFPTTWHSQVEACS